MIIGLLTTLFVFVCVLLIFIILMQEGKGSLGLGALGGGTQMLFGGSGGQDVFQKITWILGALFMFGSLSLAILKSRQAQQSRVLGQYKSAPAQQSQAPKIPQNKTV